MKILLINDYKDSIGGTEFYIKEITKQLEKNGHEIKLFTSDVSYNEYINNLGRTSFLKLVNDFFNFKYFNKIGTVLDRFTPDVIYLHSIFYELSPSILLKTRNYPTIMCIHDTKIFFPVALQTIRTGKKCKNKYCQGCINCIGLKGTIYELIKRNFHKLLLHSIDGYIGNSKYTNDLITHFKLGRPIDIRYGLKLFSYTPLIYSGNLLFVGRLAEEKGVQVILKAMPYILQKYPKTKLTIIGEGPYQKKLIKLAQLLRIENNISFLGKLPQEKIEKYYISHDIFIFPSIWGEAFGKVGLEAMSVGRPVIGSNIGGIIEWIENDKTGFLVHPDNEKSIANKVLYLLSHKDILEKISKNAKKFTDQYSIKKHTENLEKQFLKIIQTKKNN